MIGSVTTLGLSGVSIGDLYDWSVSPTVTIGHWPALFDVMGGNTTAIIITGTLTLIGDPLGDDKFLQIIDVPSSNSIGNVSATNI